MGRKGVQGAGPRSSDEFSHAFRPRNWLVGDHDSRGAGRIEDGLAGIVMYWHGFPPYPRSFLSSPTGCVSATPAPLLCGSRLR